MSGNGDGDPEYAASSPFSKRKRQTNSPEPPEHHDAYESGALQEKRVKHEQSNTEDDPQQQWFVVNITVK